MRPRRETQPPGQQHPRPRPATYRHTTTRHRPGITGRGLFCRTRWRAARFQQVAVVGGESTATCAAVRRALGNVMTQRRHVLCYTQWAYERQSSAIWHVGAVHRCLHARLLPSHRGIGVSRLGSRRTPRACILVRDVPTSPTRRMACRFLHARSPGAPLTSRRRTHSAYTKTSYTIHILNTSEFPPPLWPPSYQPHDAPARRQAVHQGGRTQGVFVFA